MPMEMERFEIILEYRVSGSNDRQVLRLLPTDYFDSSFMMFDESAVFSPPIHQSAKDYLPGLTGVLTAKLSITDTKFGLKRTFTESYWGANNTLVIVSESDADGQERKEARELILTQMMRVDSKVGWFIERWNWDLDHWRPWSCAFVEEFEDGTQKDYPIDFGA